MKNEEIKEKKNTAKKNTNQNKKESTTNKKTSTSSTKKATSKTQSAKKVAPKKKNTDQVKKERVVKEVLESNKVENDIEMEFDEDMEEKAEATATSTSNKKVKSSDIVLILGLVLVVILGAFVMKPEKLEPTYELPLVLSGEVGLHQLTYAEYQEKVDNNESFVLIIERATCSHCVNFMPVAESFAQDNNVPMYYVDTDTFSSVDWEGFEKSNTFLKKNSGNWGTPTTVVLAGKTAVDYVEGETDAESLMNLYNEYFEMPQE